MKYLILLTLLVSSTSFAQKTAGQVIKHQDFNSSVFNLGDIKQSLLPVNKFQQLNGDCWVKMTGQNISTSDYGILTGETNLPNSEGKFLRDIGGNAAALGQTQVDTLQGHAHRLRTTSGSGNFSQWNAGTAFGIASTDNAGSGNTYNYLDRDNRVRDVVSDGINGAARVSTETRPTNVSVNYFIKINKVCNFN